MNKDNSPFEGDDDNIIYVPMEVIRDIDHAINSIEKARQGLMKIAEERKTSENSESNDNEPETE